MNFHEFNLNSVDQIVTLYKLDPFMIYVRGQKGQLDYNLISEVSSMVLDGWQRHS